MILVLASYILFTFVDSVAVLGSGSALQFFVSSNGVFSLHSVALLGSGSDFQPFVSTIGVTGADLRFHYDPSLGISSYPLYHSVYETFHLVNDIMDPTFAVSLR